MIVMITYTIKVFINLHVGEIYTSYAENPLKYPCGLVQKSVLGPFINE